MTKSTDKRFPSRRRTTKSFDGCISLTEQSHKASCDIHNIMRNFERTGVLSHIAKSGGRYMDLISMPDFYQAQQAIAAAKTMFESVPAKIRFDFDNDPAKFLDFMQNAENRDAIRAYGLSDAHLPPLEPAAPATPTPPVPPAPAV